MILFTTPCGASHSYVTVEHEAQTSRAIDLLTFSAKEGSNSTNVIAFALLLFDFPLELEEATRRGQIESYNDCLFSGANNILPQGWLTDYVWEDRPPLVRMVATSNLRGICVLWNVAL